MPILYGEVKSSKSSAKNDEEEIDVTFVCYLCEENVIRSDLMR